jgi:hypothetical protein
MKQPNNIRDGIFDAIYDRGAYTAKYQKFIFDAIKQKKLSPGDRYVLCFIYEDIQPLTEPESLDISTGRRTVYDISKQRQKDIERQNEKERLLALANLLLNSDDMLLQANNSVETKDIYGMLTSIMFIEGLDDSLEKIAHKRYELFFKETNKGYIINYLNWLLSDEGVDTELFYITKDKGDFKCFVNNQDTEISALAARVCSEYISIHTQE